MVDTLPVTGEADFVSSCVGDEEVSLNKAQLEELWSLWSKYIDERGDTLLIQIPEWFSESELHARRPFLLGEVEHDDPDSGAVLFSDVHRVNISVVENQVLTDGHLGIQNYARLLDISDEDDYIDDPGFFWIPRSIMTVYERAD